MEVKITNVTYSAWKVPYLEIFCSVLPRIQTQHVRSVFLYTVRMWENMIQKNSEYGHLSRSDTLQKSSKLQKKKKKKFKKKKKKKKKKSYLVFRKDCPDRHTTPSVQILVTFYDIFIEN